MADANNNVIVSRIQHRRGLKQDLPQPLRPGEIGMATDSRQVYIGGDPTHPNSAPYNAVSYYENTLGAKELTNSIANNQIIAFSVPFVKYTRGEFNGITTVKSWQPTDARSIESATGTPAKRYHSSDYAVFNASITSSVVTTLDAGVAGSDVIVVDYTGLGTDATGNIRTGDRMTGSNVSANVMVSNVEADTSSTLRVTLTSQQTLGSGETVTFIPQVALNYNNYTSVSGSTVAGYSTLFNTASFKSQDVIVCKNGVQLIPESNSEIVTIPSATADYVLDGSNVSSTGAQSLTLRTRPGLQDEITLCYYSNANVIQAFSGVGTGKIASGSNVDSFYAAYNIPEYRQIPTENIRVSTTTGVGYVGLQNKHVDSVADGANISNPTALSLGDFLICRLDQTQPVTTVSINGSSNVAVEYYDVDFTVATDADLYSTISDDGVYRYNRVYLQSNGSEYFNNKIFDVVAAVGGGAITFQVPNTEYVMTRSGSANIAPTASYTGNGFTSNVSATRTVIRVLGDSEGISLNDYVRVLANTSVDSNVANCSLHDTIFRVTAKTNTSFDFDIVTVSDAGNSNVDFTANISSVYFVNHGANVLAHDNVYQVQSTRHGLTSETGNIEFVTEGNPFFQSEFGPGDVLPVDITTAPTSNTFFITNVAVSLTDTDFTAIGGKFGTYRPVLANSYSTLTAIPVLSIDLSANTTLTQATATVNKPLVETKTGGAAEQIFPLMDFLPKSDGSRNQVYVTQRAGYSSVEAGGLEFAIFDDSLNTMSNLGLTPGVYDKTSNSVKAKLETWMNDLINNRDCNLFSNIFSGGTLSNTALSPNHFENYYLTVDETFGEILFGSRQEAADFNFIVNNSYAESRYDRAQDSQDGTRGLVNLKNNLEIQTREAATVGEKVLTYTSMEGTTILQSDAAGETIFNLDASRYNTYKLDYSIAEVIGQANKYMRVGTMEITARPDFTDSANAVIFHDNFSSSWEIGGSDTVVEPKFTAVLAGDSINISMEDQLVIPPTGPAFYTVHTLNSTLKIKYVVQRWSSTD